MNKLVSIFLMVLCLTACGKGDSINASVSARDGINGVDGTSCSVNQVPEGAMISCSNGSSTLVSNGTNGVGCSVAQVSGGAIVTCGNTQALINDGTNGGPVGSELIYAYDPCGDSPLVFNDEILFVGSKGRVYAYFEDNASSTPYTSQTRRIAYLQPGGYITTDSKTNYCSFTVMQPQNYPNIITNEVQH